MAISTEGSQSACSDMVISQCIQYAWGNYSPFLANTTPAGCFATHEITFIDNYEWARLDVENIGCLSTYASVSRTLKFTSAVFFHCQSHNTNNQMTTLVQAENALRNMICPVEHNNTTCQIVMAVQSIWFVLCGSWLSARSHDALPTYEHQCVLLSQDAKATFIRTWAVFH